MSQSIKIHLILQTRVCGKTIFLRYGKIAAMNIFDTHAHFPEDPRKISRLLERASAAGVSQLMAVGGSTELNRSALQAASAAKTSASAPAVRLALGLDRDQVGSACSSCPKYDFSIVIDNRKSLSAIGEIGLDYHWDDVPRDIQMLYFRKQMELASKLDVPVIIHDREAHGDCLDVVKEFPTVKGIFHSFSGSPEMAQELVKLGWYISFSGPVTYKNAKQPKEACRVVPSDRILIETDAPYLPPVPHRGELNRSTYMYFTAQEIASQRGIDLEEIAKITYENAKRIFRIG